MVSISHLGRSVNDRSHNELRAGWLELLCRYPWDYFCTLTVDPKRFPSCRGEAFVKSWRRFIYLWVRAAAVAQDLAGLREVTKDVPVGAICGKRIVRTVERVTFDEPYGPWWSAWRHGRGRPVWVLGLEAHRDGRCHGHGLVKLQGKPERLDFSEGHKLWNESRGYAWLERPKSVKDVNRYVSKYVAKDGEMEISPNFDGVVETWRHMTRSSASAVDAPTPAASGTEGRG